MKYVKERTDKNGKEITRHWFLIGKREAISLLALLEKAIRYMPYTLETQSEQHRLTDMQRAIKESLKDFDYEK